MATRSGLLPFKMLFIPSGMKEEQDVLGKNPRYDVRGIGIKPMHVLSVTPKLGPKRGSPEGSTFPMAKSVPWPSQVHNET